MKIVTWNINGIRATKQPVKQILDSLDADIICLQETKVTRDLLEETSTIVEGYNSYFSFSKGKSGYSGVATFCKTHATPQLAEEGLTSVNIRAEWTTQIGHHDDVVEFTEEETERLDTEGRAVLTQHDFTDLEGVTRQVVLVNVYCPRADPERVERGTFKLRFYQLLQHRAQELLAAGRHVIILGDVNTCHKPIDHCEPGQDKEFAKHPGRQWLDGLLSSRFIDSFRHFHAEQPGAYTCWNTASSARVTNYGTRIDYIIGDAALVRDVFADCVTRPDVEGSDHCPVQATLRGAFMPATKCPELCTKYLPEFTGVQQKLSKFFTATSKGSNASDTSDKTSASVKRTSQASLISASPAKRTKLSKSSSGGGGSSKQASLASFFTKKSNSTASKGTNAQESGGRGDGAPPVQASQTVVSETPASERARSASAWRSLMTGPEVPPRCPGHSEPCVLRTVKKDSLNKGRQFWVCCRPEGHKTNPEARCDYFVWVEKKKKK